MNLIIVNEKILKYQFVGFINEFNETKVCIEEFVNLAQIRKIKMSDFISAIIAILLIQYFRKVWLIIRYFKKNGFIK